MDYYAAAILTGMIMICCAIIAAMIIPRCLAYRLDLLCQQEKAREASHRRSMELSESLEPVSELELEVRREEARARYAEAERRRRR